MTEFAETAVNFIGDHAGTIIGGGMMIGGALAKSKAQKEEGKQAQKMAQYKAKQIEDKAKFTRAVSQRNAAEDQKEAQLLESRALAVAAASGGGVSDPDVINRIGKIEAEGFLRALNTMASAETEARDLERQAFMTREEGDELAQAGKTSSTGTLISAAGNTLMSIYG